MATQIKPRSPLWRALRGADYQRDEIHEMRDTGELAPAPEGARVVVFDASGYHDLEGVLSHPTIVLHGADRCVVVQAHGHAHLSPLAWGFQRSIFCPMLLGAAIVDPRVVTCVDCGDKCPAGHVDADGDHVCRHCFASYARCACGEWSAASSGNCTACEDRETHNRVTTDTELEADSAKAP